MNKISTMLLSFLLMGGTMFAQGTKSVEIKAGTIVPLQAVNTIKAADVEEGQAVDFKVSQDVMVDGVCAIQRGTLVKGKVTEARKSSLAGTKGRLGINVSSLTLPSGDPLFFTNTDIRISGKNRTPLAVVTAIFIWPCIFIPGTKAVMPAGYEVQATVASNTRVATN